MTREEPRKVATPMQKPFEHTGTLSSLDLSRGLSDEQLLSPTTRGAPSEQSPQETPPSSQDSLGLNNGCLGH